MATDSIDPVSHAPSVPFVRALGAEWLGQNGQGICMRLPLAARACVARLDAAGDGSSRCIDLRAVVALLDHAGGAAVYAASPSMATATLELRIDITGAVLPGADVLVQARVAASGHGSALVLGSACNAGDDRPFLHTSARYIVGSGPGQAPARAGYLAEREAGVARFADVGLSAAGSFDALLGGHQRGQLGQQAQQGQPGAAWVLPFVPTLVGSVTLPALHGGVVAAGLMTSIAAASGHGTLRLSSLSVRYLRAAQAAQTVFHADVVKAGSRAAFVDAQAWQDDRLVATAQALFG